jgi:hypothetical protein
MDGIGWRCHRRQGHQKKMLIINQTNIR